MGGGDLKKIRSVEIAKSFVECMKVKDGKTEWLMLKGSARWSGYVEVG